MPDNINHLGDPIIPVRRVAPPLTEGFEFVISGDCKYKTLIVMDHWCDANAPGWRYGNNDLGQSIRIFRILQENAAVMFKVTFSEHIVEQRQASK
jgi:hypothetical protein